MTMILITVILILVDSLRTMQEFHRNGSAMRCDPTDIMIFSGQGSRKTMKTEEGHARFAMQTPSDLSQCLVLNTIAAARTLLRHYDAKLKPFDVTVQQFALLGAVRLHAGEPVATLAQRVFLDRTSLTRSLDLLERKGLVHRISGASGNVRLCELTEQGNILLDQLLPEWQQSKSELMEGISEQDAEAYLRVAKRLAR